MPLRRLTNTMVGVSLASVVLILFIFSQTRSATTASQHIMLPSQIQSAAASTSSSDITERSPPANSLQVFEETLRTIKRKNPLYPPASTMKVKFCNASLDFKARPFVEDKPVLYIVTPTYSRREQYIEILRLSHTLLHVDNVIWVIAEDSEKCSPLLEDMLGRFGIPFAHMASPMPGLYKKEKYKPRGVASRRAGYDWVLKNHPLLFAGDRVEGVVFFADDDNTYDLEIFEELRKTRRISVFPVGFVGAKGSPGVSSPIVDLNTGKVIGFSDSWFAHRLFPVDMAGFGLNVGFAMTRPNASMPFWAGYEEDVFLQSLGISLDDLEPLASNCTRILVWHTQTVKQKSPKVKLTKNTDTSLKGLVSDVVYKGQAILDEKTKNELKTCMNAEKCGEYSNLK